MLDVQGHDSTISRLKHQRANLPVVLVLSELEKELSVLNGQRIAAQTRVSDLEREQSKADNEVELVKARRARDEERLNSGAVSSPKDLANLQHEVVALERRIATLEDAELEIMETLEAAQGELAALIAQVDQISAKLSEAEAERDESVAAIDAELSQVESERAALAPALPEALVKLYDKLRANSGGVGAAVLRARRCEGCRLELNGADLREIGTAPADELLRCPECSRILIRTEHSGV